jgi:hypothetical protein
MLPRLTKAGAPGVPATGGLCAMSTMASGVVMVVVVSAGLMATSSFASGTLPMPLASVMVTGCNEAPAAIVTDPLGRMPPAKALVATNDASGDCTW